MNKLLKKAIFSLSVILTLFLSSTSALAADSITGKFDKHRVPDSDKPQVENALKKINYQEIINRLYPTKSKVTFSEPVRIYTLEKENILKKYNKSSILTTFITKDYEIIQSIKDGNGNVIGLVNFRKGKGLDAAQDALNAAPNQQAKDDLIKFTKENEGKWYVSSMGGVIPNEGTALLTDFNVIEQKLNELGIDNVKDLFILATSGYLPPMIYIQTEKDEYVMPLAVGEKNYQTGKLYKLEDFIINVKLMDEAAASAQATSGGGGSVSLPAMKAVTHVDDTRGFSASSFISSSIVLAIVACFAVSYKIRLGFWKR